MNVTTTITVTADEQYYIEIAEAIGWQPTIRQNDEDVPNPTPAIEAAKNWAKEQMTKMLCDLFVNKRRQIKAQQLQAELSLKDEQTKAMVAQCISVE